MVIAVFREPRQEEGPRYFSLLRSFPENEDRFSDYVMRLLNRLMPGREKGGMLDYRVSKIEVEMDFKQSSLIA